MIKRLKYILIITAISLIIIILTGIIIGNNVNIPAVLAIMLSPFSFLSVPCAITGLILIVLDLFFRDTDKSKLGTILMLSGGVMFLMGIYGFSTGGLSNIVSKICEFGFIFWLPFIIIGIMLKFFSKKL